jgi:hypothetical protein
LVILLLISCCTLEIGDVATLQAPRVLVPLHIRAPKLQAVLVKIANYHWLLQLDGVKIDLDEHNYRVYEVRSRELGSHSRAAAL